MPNAVFVYGTLKQGEQRGQLWPRSPQQVQQATTCGCLYDLGPYPALVSGELPVCGELWQFDPADMAATLAVLDRIEGYAGTIVDLYVREEVDCQTADGSTHRAYTYFYANPHQLRASQQVQRDAQGQQSWHGRSG